MKDEIKKINISFPGQILDYVDTKEHLLELYDFITNLQEKLEVSETNEETYRLEMLDITKCLGLDEDTIFDEVKEKATNLQEENERLKNKIEEAIKKLEIIMSNAGIYF